MKSVIEEICKMYLFISSCENEKDLRYENYLEFAVAAVTNDRITSFSCENSCSSCSSSVAEPGRAVAAVDDDGNEAQTEDNANLHLDAELANTDKREMETPPAAKAERSETKKTIYTVGYGNLQPDAFFGMLKDNQITHIVDVRADATGWNAKYHGPAMEKELKECGIHYQHIPDLGVPKAMRDSLPEGYEVLPDDFKTEYRERVAPCLVDHIDTFNGAKTALLCSEKDPRRCHRSILAKMLVASGRFDCGGDLSECSSKKRDGRRLPTKKEPGPEHLAEVEEAARALRAEGKGGTVGNVQEKIDLDLPDISHALRFLHDHRGWHEDGKGGYLTPGETI